MKKIVSLFKRDYEGTRLVYNAIVDGAEWVQKGEGIATEKIDGTSCLWKGGILFRRYDAKRGRQPPPDFIPAQDPDPITGHWPGWLIVSPNKPEDKWHMEAILALGLSPSLEDGVTCELIGPRIQGNPYGRVIHSFRKHGDVILPDVPRDFEGIKEYLASHPQYEGIVWHHPDGRMVKIKARDFGLPWPKIALA